MIEQWLSQHVSALSTAESGVDVRLQLIAAATESGFDTIACGEIDLDDRRRSTFFINTWP